MAFLLRNRLLIRCCFRSHVLCSDINLWYIAQTWCTISNSLTYLLTYFDEIFWKGWRGASKMWLDFGSDLDFLEWILKQPLLFSAINTDHIKLFAFARWQWRSWQRLRFLISSCWLFYLLIACDWFGCHGGSVVRALNSGLVRLTVGSLSGNNLGQVVCTRASVSKQYNLVLVKAPWSFVVTISLALHWPCVADFSLNFCD